MLRMATGERTRQSLLLLSALGFGGALGAAWLTADLSWKTGAAAIGLALAFVVGVSKTSSA